VRSTLPQARDADYRLVEIKDCCADLDLELHSVFIKRSFPTHADTTSAEDFVTALENLS
jgi:hypothetical protein